MTNTWTIGTIAKLAGLRTSAIRYYESAGVLLAPSRARGQRRYSPDMLVQLAVIRRSQDLGFTVAEIRELFHAFPDDAPASERWQALARQKIAEIDALIARAESMRTSLGTSLECRCDTFDSCTMLRDEPLSTGAAQ